MLNLPGKLSQSSGHKICTSNTHGIDLQRELSSSCFIIPQLNGQLQDATRRQLETCSPSLSPEVYRRQTAKVPAMWNINMQLHHDTRVCCSKGAKGRCSCSMLCYYSNWVKTFNEYTVTTLIHTIKTRHVLPTTDCSAIILSYSRLYGCLLDFSFIGF